MWGSVLATNTRKLKFMRPPGFGREPDPDGRSKVRQVRAL
jgi:hypothetical protein